MEFSIDRLISLSTNFLSSLKKLQFSSQAQLAFLEDLYTLINDGIPANRAIEMLGSVSEGINREVALSIEQKISEGQPLAEGMRDWFSLSVVEIIRIGEEGGALAQTIKSAINALAQKGGTISALLSSILYPLLVFVIACVLILYLNNSIFPQFADIKPISQWPSAGQLMVSLAGIIKKWWWVCIAIVIFIILIFRHVMRNYTGELRPLLDSIPPFTFYKKITAAYVLETLGLLVSSGVVFKNAIKVMQYQANPYLSSHLIMMEHLLGKGKGNIAEVLSTGLITDSDLLRLRVMAEVKGFEHGLIRMGIKGAESTAKTLKLIAKIVGGLLLAMDAGLVILIIQGVYMTGMSLGGAPPTS